MPPAYKSPTASSFSTPFAYKPSAASSASKPLPYKPPAASSLSAPLQKKLSSVPSASRVSTSSSPAFIVYRQRITRARSLASFFTLSTITSDNSRSPNSSNMSYLQKTCSPAAPTMLLFSSAAHKFPQAALPSPQARLPVRMRRRL